MKTDKIAEILGKENQDLLLHKCETISKENLHLPGPDFVDRIFGNSDRSIRVLQNLERLFQHGRLKGTGYLSILPVDQGVEHSGGSAFAPNPIYFDPENIVKLAIEGDCNAVASSVGVLASVARRYAHKIPFIVKINHNELLSYPNSYDQRLFASVKEAYQLGACGIGATIYFGSEQSRDQIEEVGAMFETAHQLGLFTVLWCYLRNPAFKNENEDFHASADLTGQANHLGATLKADIIKQKQPVNNRGYLEVKFGKTHPLVYEKLTTDHPIDLTRYQVLNCYMGRIGLINSGGESGKNDLQQVVKTAVINKRAGGMGLITGRKAFQKDMKTGIELFHAIQDVYLTNEIDIA